MCGVVVDLKDRGLQTAEQRVRVFFGQYNYGMVEEQLWEVFRVYAVNREKMETGLESREVAVLLDQLISLVWAVESLEQGRGSMLVDTGRFKDGADRGDAGGGPEGS